MVKKTFGIVDIVDDTVEDIVDIIVIIIIIVIADPKNLNPNKEDL